MKPQQAKARGRSTERGAGVVVVALALAVGVVGAAVILAGHGRQITAARAQAAADATALAIAGADRPLGERVARLNGADLVAVTQTGNDVRVVVRYRQVERSATARWELVWLPPKPGS